MEAADPLLPARTQPHLRIDIHILFPSISLALALDPDLLQCPIYARDLTCLDIYRLWTKFIPLTVAMCVVSGIVISFHSASIRKKTQSIRFFYT